MDGAEIEGEVDLLYRVARQDAREPSCIFGLAGCTPGIERVEFVDLPPPFASELCANDGDARACIRLQESLSDRAARFLCAHELIEWRLRQRRLPYVESDRERVVNSIAACAVMPTPALREAHVRIGPEPALLADRFRTSQTVATLRLGEALGYSVAIVAPHFLRRRGPAALPHDAALVRLVRAGKAPKGVRVLRLTDARWRWAVIGTRDW